VSPADGAGLCGRHRKHYWNEMLKNAGSLPYALAALNEAQIGSSISMPIECQFARFVLDRSRCPCSALKVSTLLK
jgi:hypothetical protein